MLKSVLRPKKVQLNFGLSLLTWTKTIKNGRKPVNLTGNKLTSYAWTCLFNCAKLRNYVTFYVIV